MSHETPEDGERRAGSKKDELPQSGVGSGNPTVQAKSLFASVKTFGMASQNSRGPCSHYREDKVLDSDVLVDSGANEVVRPYSESSFEEIILGLKGELCKVCLAGGTVVVVAMTQYGEIMFPKEARSSVDSKWIVPVCRLTTELGCVITWDRRGMRLNFPSGGGNRDEDSSRLMLCKLGRL